MKFSKIVFILLFLSILGHAQNSYFVKFNSNISREQISEKITDINSTQTESNSGVNFKIQADFLSKGIATNIEPLRNIIKISINRNKNIDDVLNDFGINKSDIEYIQPSTTYRINSIPNDSLLSLQWALTKIDAVNAWNITKGSSSVIVGIIDTGIDYEHPDLRNKLFINQGELGIDINGNDKRFNGIDDDSNGFIDDYMGWDFTDRNGFPFDSTGGDYLNWDNDPMDENVYSHGTAVAGIIGAETNNLIGIAGVAPHIKFLNLRAFDPDGFGEEDDVASAILYAVANGVKVINMSFGDYSFSYVLRDVIRYAYSQGVVLVASSGNSNSSAPHYPSGYSEVISVGNSTREDYVASSSNYGSTLDLVAPGTSILTTLRRGAYGDFNGTSAAAPFISASAALILSLNNFSNDEVKQIIKSTTDDLNEVGWDMRSGAGRLNLNKALTSLSTSVIKFNFPLQDYATKNDTLNVVATVLSPYFLRYELFWGTGLNPTKWNNLINNGQYQISSDSIYSLNISSFADSVYTLRLVIHQSNGRTLEERVNFHIDRKIPQGEVVSLFPAYYGDKPTIMAAFYTPNPSIVRMYYKKTGEVSFQSVSLDGLATNNQFVKKLHYGFIPPQFISFNSNYQIYFEIENLLGIKNIITNNGSNFTVNTNKLISQIAKYEMEFSLPPGLLFEEPVNLLSAEKNEVFIREINNSTITRILSFETTNKFIKVDSLTERIPKDFGDWNNNGRKNLLTNWGRSTYLLEEDSPNSGKFKNISSIENNAWPILIDDVDKDGINELLTIVSDSIINVYKVRNNLTLDSVATVRNYTSKSFGKNVFDSPSALIIDTDNDGINELWLVDADGDIFGYNILPNNNYVPILNKVIRTEFSSASNYITSGDFDGDGKIDIAIILHSVPELDIASYHRVIVFNNSSTTLNILYDNAFVDPASEFNRFTRRTYNNLKLVDIDNDGKSELVLFLFPYSFIIKHNSTSSDVISFDENINANVIFVSDFNKNNVPEIAFPYNDKIRFYEFASSNKAYTPTHVKGFSIDSIRAKLTWYGQGNKFYIYKNLKGEESQLIDSTTTNSYIDSNIELNKFYNYRVQAIDITKQIELSEISNLVEVYHHKPAKVLSVEPKSDRSILIRFSERINPTIENPKSFEFFKGVNQLSIYPSSLTAADQYSYVVTFTESFEDGLNIFQINDFNDYYGSPAIKELVSFFYSPQPQLTEFFVELSEIINPYLVKIKFNYGVDENSVKDKSNYIFYPSNFVTDISIDASDKSIIYISLKGANAVGSIGQEYRLSIQNIYSSNSSGYIPIKKGAGSVIILTKFAENLSDVYFYPSPAKIQDGNGKITFANLPKFAELSIWSLSGEKIITLKEKDGDGGLSWNFISHDGKLIGSGIYIYRIAMLNSSNEELDVKLGKIAVVK